MSQRAVGRCKGTSTGVAWPYANDPGMAGAVWSQPPESNQRVAALDLRPVDCADGVRAFVVAACADVVCGHLTLGELGNCCGVRGVALLPGAVPCPYCGDIHCLHGVAARYPVVGNALVAIVADLHHDLRGRLDWSVHRARH